jgi:hypothetical protein
MAAGLVMASCGGGGDSAPLSKTTEVKPIVTSTSAPATTTEPAARAVIAAYRAGWAAFEHALADANPEDPELAATMVDPELQRVKANLLADQRQGMVGRGTTTLHPKLTSLSATLSRITEVVRSRSSKMYR